jgi:hypothetical protein
MNWLGDRIRQLQETVWNHKPLGPAAPYALPNYFYPNDPIWRSAKTSGKVVRLNQNEPTITTASSQPPSSTTRPSPCPKKASSSSAPESTNSPPTT